MSAFKAFIETAAHDFNLGYRADSVVRTLASWVLSHPLGLDGFAQQFEQVGLGAKFQSWQRHDVLSQPLLVSELEKALGHHALVTLARRTGFPTGTFRVLACELLPGLVALLTVPGGAAKTQAHLARSQRTVAARGRMYGGGPSWAMHGIALRAMLWALAACGVLAITGWVYLKARTPMWSAPVVTAQVPSTLSVRQRAGQVWLEGRLPQESDRRQVWNAWSRVHGQTNVRAHIALDPAAIKPAWLNRVVARAPSLQGDGLALAFEGEQLRVDSSRMPDPQRRAISQMLRDQFPDLQITGLWGPGLAAIAEVAPQLGPQWNPAPLEQALNQTTLRFFPGSATLTGDSRDTVEAVARVLRSAPAGTRIHVGAHTANFGRPVFSEELSQRRAEAVVQRLQAEGVQPDLLVAVGLGQGAPVADNREEAGRRQNQRVVFTVQPGGAQAKAEQASLAAR